MKIIIDVPENYYEWIMCLPAKCVGPAEWFIANGKVIPENNDNVVPCPKDGWRREK